MKTLVCAFLVLCLASSVQAKIETESVEYKQGDTNLRGYMAYDDAAKGERPGVLVVHEWWGLNDYAKMRVRKLAEAGYVAFALDMYGEGKTTEHPQEAGEWATQVRMNKELGAERFKAAYDILKKNKSVRPDKIAAIGYCFGGSVVLTMALQGVGLDGVVSFHGSLPTDSIQADVKAKVLVCHGEQDSFTTGEQIDTFKKNLTAASVDWQFISYGGAKHSFTDPNADDRGLPPLSYNAAADRRSWQAMLSFFDEIFGSE
ncbi:MAG: dienelactone hydrolase family protein [Candidatus Krumholzibacteria bacterium]|nr:dienelactone hydrolase family protein [Candidatus Krumholzibacteria bacterium]